MDDDVISLNSSVENDIRSSSVSDNDGCLDSDGITESRDGGYTSESDSEEVYSRDSYPRKKQSKKPLNNEKSEKRKFSKSNRNNNNNTNTNKSTKVHKKIKSEVYSASFSIDDALQDTHKVVTSSASKQHPHEILDTSYDSNENDHNSEYSDDDSILLLSPPLDNRKRKMSGSKCSTSSIKKSEQSVARTATANDKEGSLSSPLRSRNNKKQAKTSSPVINSGEEDSSSSNPHRCVGTRPAGVVSASRRKVIHSDSEDGDS